MDSSRSHARQMECQVQHADGTISYEKVTTNNPRPTSKLLTLPDAEASIEALGAAGHEFLQARLAAQRAIDAAEEAECALARSIAQQMNDGRISQREVAKKYQAFRVLARPGYSSRWDEFVPLTRAMIENQMFYDPDPDGKWRGPWPLDWGTSVPLPGQSVVYYLYDGSFTCCYIGSSGNLRARMKKHRSDGKIFSSWMAEPHVDRQAAYEAEDALLKVGPVPIYNLRAGR